MNKKKLYARERPKDCRQCSLWNDKGKRTDLTLSQVGTKLRTDQIMANELGESRNQIQRYIRLTNLIPELLEMVDKKKLSFNPAVELSYLTENQQKDFLSAMDYAQAAPSLSQAQRIKKLAQSQNDKEGSTDDSSDNNESGYSLKAMCDIMNEQKKEDKSQVKLSTDVLQKYFPKSYTPKQMQDTIIKLLDQWQKKKNRTQER